jgi:hypothetical protein
MSLLKARDWKNLDGDTYSDLEMSFQLALDNERINESLLASLIDIYAVYSVLYLREVSLTLKEPLTIQQTMKFMNSYIAEIAHKIEVPYFHKEEGYSLIDKAVQFVLDNGTSDSTDYVKSIMENIVVKEVEEDEE